MYTTILTTGDEVLAGIVQDTNTSWLCREVTELGGSVKRAIVAPDEADVIGGEIRAFLTNPKSNILLVTGGLGPTEDDITLDAIGAALDREVKALPEAVEFLNGRLAELFKTDETRKPEVDEISIKMAEMPVGSEIIPQSTGAAPGALIQVNENIIIVMPGVPSEMYDMFTNHVAPVLANYYGDKKYLETVITTNATSEGVTAKLFAEFHSDHPELYVKSRKRVPTNAPDNSPSFVSATLTLHSDTQDNLDDEAEELSKRLGEIDVEVVEVQTNYSS